MKKQHKLNQDVLDMLVNLLETPVKSEDPFSERALLELDYSSPIRRHIPSFEAHDPLKE